MVPKQNQFLILFNIQIYTFKFIEVGTEENFWNFKSNDFGQEMTVETQCVAYAENSSWRSSVIFCPVNSYGHSWKNETSE